MTFSLRGPIEDCIDHVERYHAAADDCARRDCAPQDISAGELPDRQQARYDGYQNAATRSPERNLGDDLWIEEAPFHWSRHLSAD